MGVKEGSTLPLASGSLTTFSILSRRVSRVLHPDRFPSRRVTGGRGLSGLYLGPHVVGNTRPDLEPQVSTRPRYGE